MFKASSKCSPKSPLWVRDSESCISVHSVYTEPGVWQLFRNNCYMLLKNILSWGYRFTPVRVAIVKKSTNNKCWRGCGEKGTLLHCWGECKLVQPLWKTVWRFLKKLKTELPYDPAIPFLGIYLEKTIIWKDTCTPVFIAALFTIVKTWKQPKCPSADKWIMKMWYIYNGILLSHKKEWNNAICSNMDGPRDYPTKWSKSEKDKYHMIPYVESKIWHKWTYQW